jgi:hypothetical protein
MSGIALGPLLGEALLSGVSMASGALPQILTGILVELWPVFGVAAFLSGGRIAHSVSTDSASGTVFYLGVSIVSAFLVGVSLLSGGGDAAMAAIGL